MPGGGLYKRVAQATKTAESGPDHLLQSAKLDVTQLASTSPEAEVEATAEACDVQAFNVWYWNQPEDGDSSFVPETMYMNSQDSGHQTGEPRLIVSLTSFEALSQAYVMSVEKEGIKASLLQEKEDLLQEVRVGYYKELQHLRELLSMAKEQMALARGVNRLEEADRKRMEEFEREVRDTDVHYFNIVEYLEPELKTIMKDALKQFNRHLMLENFNLRDRLALHEGTEGEEGLAERLITLLMGKGSSPADIVKILAGMVSDKQQSDDFAQSCRDILGISKAPLEREEIKKRPVKVKEVEEEVKTPSKTRVIQAEEHHDDPEAAAKQKAMEEAALAAKMEAEKLREQMAAMMAQVQQDKAAFEKERAELKRLVEQEQKRATEAAQALKALEVKLEKALDDVEKAKAGVKVVEKRVSSKGHHDEDTTPGGSKKKRPKHDDDEDDTPSRKKSPREKSHSGPSQKDLEAARKKAEDAEAKLKELEARLHQANKRIDELNDDVAKAQAEADAERAKAALAASMKRGSSKESVGETTPGGTRIRKIEEKPEKQERQKIPEKEEQTEYPQVDPKKPTKYQGEGSAFVERAKANTDRSGEYSAVSGKPVKTVEEELARERKMRINLEGQTRNMTVKINDLADGKFTLEVQCKKQGHDLEETRRKLQKLIDEDESDGVEDVQIFCRWLVRRYGSLENGFRALDANRSGGLSVSEFNVGLTQMGWIKIVGRRLFKIIDTLEKGEIDMSDLTRVWEKFVDGGQDDQEIAETLAKAELDMKADEKNQLGEVRERMRKLIIQNNDIEEENKRLESALKKAEMRTKNSKGGEDDGMKNMERKNDLIKDSYEKLKEERDEMTSKMTAAMWKCRESHILQVKYQRQAETSQAETKKLQKKYDTVRAAYKKKHAEDPDGPAEDFFAGATANAANMASMAAMSNSMAAVSTAFFTNPSNLTKNFSIEALDADSASGMVTSTASWRPGSPDGDNAMQPARLDGDSNAMHCPKCKAVLRLNPLPTAASTLQTAFQNSASPAGMRSMLKDFAGGGDDAAGLAGLAGLFGDEDRAGTPDKRAQMTPEEMLANMTDEDLLFGSPTAQGGRAGHTGRSMPPGNMGGALGASYRNKTEDHVAKHGRKHRWQLLFSDAQDRRVMSDSLRPGSPSTGQPVPEDGAPPTVLSKETMNLLEHAERVRGIWKEAVPIESLAGKDSKSYASARADSPDGELRGADAVRVLGTSRSFGVGGCCVSQSMAGSMGGRIHLGPPRRDVQSPRGASPPLPSPLRGEPLSSPVRSAQNTAPPPTSFLDANNLIPSAEGTTEGFFPSGVSSLIDSMQRQSHPKNQKRHSQKAEGSPRGTPTPPTPNLQIVGNVSDNGWAKLGSDLPASASRTPPKGLSRTSPLPTATPPLTVTTWETANLLPNHDDFDEGLQGHSMGGHGSTKVVGSWNKRGLIRAGDSDLEPVPKALGSGLPSTPDLIANQRNSSSLSRGALRRVPAQLPHLSDSARTPSKASKMLSVSMPDLGIMFERPPTSVLQNAVRTPPIAAEEMQQRVQPLQPSPTKRGLKSTRGLGQSGSRYGAGDGAAGAVPFEVPLLYVGNAPTGPVGVQGKLEASIRSSHAHSGPSPEKGNPFMMAASALELGSHVQRHAATEDVTVGAASQSSPMIVQHAPASRRLLS